MRIEETKVCGFNTKTFSLNNIRVGIATDMGPRILYLASREKPEFNLFGLLPEAGVSTPAGFWRLYGGHRLWSSPEAMPRSYSMDDKPVKIAANEDGITVEGNPETENSVQKKITIKPYSEDGIQVVHSIKNIGRWSVRLGCWALSVMRQNGFAIIPLKPSKVDAEGLLPDRRMSLWPYTDPSDERLKFKNGYIFVRQNPAAQAPLKIGAMANPPWTAYWVGGTVFVKEFLSQKAEYPDFGCNVEVYTNASMLELETLGPLGILNPSECAQHTEIWRVFPVSGLSPEPEAVKTKLEALLGH